MEVLPFRKGEIEGISTQTRKKLEDKSMETTQPSLLHGLYIITDPKRTDKTGLIPAVSAAVQGGAKIVQYRNKEADYAQQKWEIFDLLTLCRPLNIPVLINDDADLAAETDADGVHIGVEDGAIEAAREKLGKNKIIGVSCYNDPLRAQQAEQSGADYVAFGRFFPSQTKPQAVQAEPKLLREAKQKLSIPIVAIGGITPENGKTLVDAGADMLAVIHAVWNFGETEKIQQTARKIVSLFEK